jgi:hypothetical protein
MCVCVQTVQWFFVQQFCGDFMCGFKLIAQNVNTLICLNELIVCIAKGETETLRVTEDAAHPV